MMAVRDRSLHLVRERCFECGRTTSHHVSVEIRTESTKAKNVEFSREPYRVTRCLVCQTTSSLRMNNA